MRSTTSHQFSNIPRANIERSTFQRTHGYKTTFDAGKLIPFYVDEVLPGDTFAVHATLFARLATPFVPVMDNLFLDTFYFFVPNRLIWEHWQNFMGELEDPDDLGVVDYLNPVVNAPAGGFASGSLADYFGIPTKIAGLSVNALPFRAYNLIWNEWFRDENLQSKVKNNRTDGPDTDTDYTVLNRNKRHDYFTSALPWPQKGPGVELPLSGNMNIVPATANSSPKFRIMGSPTAPGALTIDTPTGGYGVTQVPTGGDAYGGPAVWGTNPGDTGLVGNLDSTTAVTINSLREAFQIQRLYERDARGGSRYTELIRSHFGVISPDARLQRPEFLGGGSTRVNINQVAQTSGSPQDSGGYTTTPQGNLAAFGTVGLNNGFTKSFVEHGIIIGLLEVRADLTYQQGLNRMWSRQTRFDYYWPVLAHLGEQAIYNREIYAQGPGIIDPATDQPMDESIFGYQERWAEYRYKPSLITGQFRSNYDEPLDVWHLAQKFDNLPTLGSTFITDNPPVKRISAVPSYPDFLLDSYIDIKATRPMPTYSVPGMIDHF